MLLFQHFMKDSTKAALAHMVSATENDNHHNEEKPTTNCQVVSYLLATYDTGDVEAES